MLNKDNLKNFLIAVDKSFPTPLSEKQDLDMLAEKFIQKATLCYAEDQNAITALVAGYTENVTDNMAYISVVATLEASRGKGLASGLICEFVAIARDKGLDGVHLYAVRSNIAAVKMYHKLGFTEWNCVDEVRPHDLHLIYRIREKKI